MKSRNDFVTNSSSSSFIIQKKDLTDEQLLIITSPLVKASELGLDKYDDPHSWALYENDNEIIGLTTMDNFDWLEYLNRIGITNLERTYENGAGVMGLDIIYNKGIDPWGLGQAGYTRLRFLDKENRPSIFDIDDILEDMEDED